MKRIAFFLASLYCFAACNNEIIDDPAFPADEKNPQIELFFPDAEQVNVYSTATYNENLIDTVWVLVFAENTLNKKWVEKIEGSQIVRNGFATQLLPQLKNKPASGDTIICIANVDPVLMADTIGLTVANINDRFRLLNNGFYSGTSRLPMSGGFRWSPSSGCICEMTRAVAKIQIQMGTTTGVSDATGNFTADNVFYQIYHIPQAGYIIPTTPISGIPALSRDFIREEYLLLQNKNVTEAKSNAYLPEYPFSKTTCTGGPDINKSIFHVDRQFILLCKENRDEFDYIIDTTYYRMDFYDAKIDTFIDTKRNHHYLFTINRIRSEGYKTRTEAMQNPGSNIEYTVFINDDAKDIISNGQYAIVATLDRTTIGAQDGVDYPVGSVRYYLPAGVSAPATNEIKLVVTSSTSNPSAPLDPTALTLSSPSPAEMTSSNQTVSIFVKSGIVGAEGVLTFRLGNITYQKNISFRSGS